MIRTYEKWSVRHDNQQGDDSPEVWRDVPNYEGLYEVSNKGRVKSVQRRVWVESFGGRGGAYKTVRERILKPINHYGFLAVNLYNSDGESNKFEIGELVLTAFVGERPPNKDVCRWNKDKRDNCASNLYWYWRPNRAPRRMYFRPFRVTFHKKKEREDA